MLPPELIEKIKSTKVYTLSRRHCIVILLAPPITASAVRPIVRGVRAGVVEFLGLEGDVRVMVVEDNESIRIFAGLEDE